MSRARRPRLLQPSETARLAVAGLLLALAFPPLPFGLVSLVALTPLLSVLDDDPRPGFRRGFLHGAAFGSAFYLLLLFWLWDLIRFTPLIVASWLLASLYLGSLTGLAVAAAQWARARTGRSAALFLPFAWVGLEKLLQYGDLRFTWGVLADTLTPYPLLLQTAELWGGLGISFLIVAVNGLAYAAWRRRGEPAALRRIALPLVTLAVAVLGYGALRWSALGSSARSGAMVRVAVIQPDIPQDARDDPGRADFEKRRLWELSRRAMERSPDLVVWPETAAPWLRYDAGYLSDLSALCCGGPPGTGVPFLVGGLDAVDAGEARERIFNAAFMVSSAGELTGVYRKVLLVPMTEQVPYAGVLGLLKPERWSGSFGAGEGFVPLSFHPPGPSRGAVRVGTPICYEITFPQAIRGFRLAGARLIVTITNDAWFGRTAAPFQHFSQLRLRAVEHRIAIARAANTGISGFVSARGDVIRKTGIFHPAFLVQDLPLAGPLTPYARFGDWILPASWAGLGLALGGARLRRRTRRRPDAPPPPPVALRPAEPERAGVG